MSYVTIGSERIRVSTDAVREELPDRLDKEKINSAAIYLNEERPAETLAIEFSEKESNPKKRYAVQQHPDYADAIHISAKQPVRTILMDRVEGRYACEWDDDEEMLFVDLTDLKKAHVGED